MSSDSSQQEPTPVALTLTSERKGASIEATASMNTLWTWEELLLELAPWLPLQTWLMSAPHAPGKLARKLI